MKKQHKVIITIVSVLLALTFCLGMVGCNQPTTNTPGDNTGGGNTPVTGVTGGAEIGGFNLPYSAGQATDEFYDYNSDLYYLNETRLNGADPGALFTSEADIIDSYNKLMQTWKYKDANGEFQWQNGKSQEAFEKTYGTLDSWLAEYADWYYMIVTGNGGNSAYFLWSSKDLFDWKLAGKANEGRAISFDTKVDWTSGQHFWAPEFVRDPVSGLYFIFFSCNSKNGNANTTYSANVSSTGYDFDGLQVSCAMSVTPTGPYTFVTAEEYLLHRAAKNADGSVKLGETAVDSADLNRDGYPDAKIYEMYDYAGNVIGYKSKAGGYYNLNGYQITRADPVLNIGYYYPRLASDKTKIAQMEEKYHVNKTPGLTYDNCIFPCIDVNPVVASDGTMMLYFSQHMSTRIAGNHVWCVQMKDWMTPDWDTLTHISTPGYEYIVQDGSFEGQLGPKTTFNEGNINEGTEVLEHKGKWYFTYSPFGYGSREYSIYVAVADNPLGPFYKLGTAYSPVIGIGGEFNDYMSGTGHHCWLQAGDELWALYHCFYNPEDNNDNQGNFMGRAIGADRVFWKYTPELGYDMLYGNGPTYNLQPKPETYTGYTNVAKYAKIEGNGVEPYGDASVLNDGMFTAQPFSRQWEYGREDGHLKIKLTWEKPVTITAFNIYNSGYIYTAFKNIDSVLFKLYEQPKWYQSTYNGYCYIKDLPTYEADYNLSQSVVRKGASAMAMFDPITVTEMTIYISGDAEDKYVTEDKDFTYIDGDYRGVRVSEIYIFGNEVA